MWENIYIVRPLHNLAVKQMKLTIFNGIGLTFIGLLAAVQIAGGQEEIAIRTSHDVTQADADSKKTYDLVPPGAQNGDWTETIYNIKESVTFEGYDRDATASDAFGNIFQRPSSMGGWMHRSTSIIVGNDEAEYDLIFSDNHTVYRYDGSEMGSGTRGGGAGLFDDVTFKNLRSVQVINNSLTNLMDKGNGQAWAYGGGLDTNELILDHVGLFLVEGNTASGTDTVMGGGIGMGGGFNTQGTGDIVFRNNTISLVHGGAWGYGGGYGNLNGGSLSLVANAGTIKFVGNGISYGEALEGEQTSIYMRGGAIFDTNAHYQNTKTIEFSRNYVDGRGQDQVVRAWGGAIDSATVAFRGIKAADGEEYAIHFSNNRAVTNGAEGSTGRGGAIYANQVNIRESGDVLFENNYATTKGGAIFLRDGGGSGVREHLIYADYGDITFKGNTDSLAASGERNSGVSNAIHLANGSQSHTFYLQAAEGQSVNFYDPFTSDMTDYNKLVFNLNSTSAEPLHTGTIRFSGKYAAQALAGSEGSADYAERLARSKVSDLRATINLYRGTLVLEEGVTLGAKMVEKVDGVVYGAYFNMKGGLLDISGSLENGVTTLSGTWLYFQNILDANDAPVLKIGEYSAFDADVVNMSKGITVDLGYYFSGQNIIDHQGLDVNTVYDFTIDGTLVLLDNNANFYQDGKWRSDQAFVLFDVADVGELVGEFDGIVSSLTGSNVVDGMPYEGEWSIGLEGDKIVARWKALSLIPEASSATLGLFGVCLLGLRRRK